MISNKELMAYSESIEALYGIKLKWYEKISLKNYINSFET